MEIHFELTPEDVQALIDETVDARVKRNDKYFDWQGRHLPRLLMTLVLLGAALSPWLLHGRYTLESIIALVLVLPLAFIVLRRFSSGLMAFGQKPAQRIRLRSHASLSARLRKQMEPARSALPGLHTWHISPDTLRIVLPNGQQSVIPRPALAHLSQTPSFYRLATRTQKLAGLAYALPKQSRAMDASAYEQGVALLLQGNAKHADAAIRE
ncbi:hypothetical protein AU05_20650 [Ectopseudomonas composti]|jgi:hypothetical protein|uniref:DUF3137 domain-containing protein n=1 Tax=Ectopseudomonas composti TaxID=658457 RepID=A0ABN0S8Y9_9GAMM|nr:hypothetical protein [Pseudomonas composti]EZH78422.1 hypothetical protein AU05_20650 [Pseudomonas composti]